MVHFELIGWGVKLKVDTRGSVYVTVPKGMEGLYGLCGDGDGNPDSKYTCCATIIRAVYSASCFVL